MRILITGGGGQLGRSLQRTLNEHHVLAMTHVQLDVTQPSSVAAAFQSHRPQVVVHAAALTDTTRCEREPATARAINGLGSEQVARACQQVNARLIMISTNEVYDGAKRAPYVETDPTGPLNAYAVSKLDGEWLASAACAHTLILRTSWLYGDGGANFVQKVRDAGLAGRKLSFVTDEVATPTSTDDLADAIRKLIECDASPGIYHLTNTGEASRYHWAKAVLRLGGIVDTTTEGITTAKLRANGYDGPRKPPYTVLANTRAQVLGISLRSWQDALAAYFERARVTLDA